jgi:serine/threonine-protein kinase RsbW
MEPGARDVSLTIPAKPGYLVLARLALAAVCRLTALGPAEVADLKLAVTEAAGEFIDEDTAEEADDERVDFKFRLMEDRLVLELSGPPSEGEGMELELGRAIIEATVDESEFENGRTRLVKRL